MSTFEAIVLGLVQGLTEFLPISSSGHLRIVPAFLGWEDPGAGFTAVIQLGTMAAVLLYFRGDLLADRAWPGCASFASPSASAATRRSWAGSSSSGTIPISIFGFVFKDQIESGARDLYLIGSALILFSLRDAARRARGHAAARARRDERRATGSSSASPRRWR